MDLTRRDALTGTLYGSLGGALAAHGALNEQSEKVFESKRKRNLTIKEMPEAELAEMERLLSEANQAAGRMGAYERSLREKYGECNGVEVHFDQGYVFVRDYREEMKAKQRASQEYLNVAVPQAPTGWRG